MEDMKRRDARALDHKTLQEIRIRAVERVQAGESPEAVIQALGFTRSCVYTWLARYRSGGWGALKARALKGRPMKIQATQMRCGSIVRSRARVRCSSASSLRSGLGR